MIDALYISENALRANQDWITNISHNVANINTPGFKRSDVQFLDMVSTQHSNDGTGTIVGMGSVMNANSTDFKVGELRQTNRELDVAIDGPGFIEIQQDNGQFAYTKLGSFIIASDGRLTLADGSSLANDINIPSNATSIVLDKNGTVRANLDGGITVIEVGQITLSRFASPQALTPIGQGRFVANEVSGDPTTFIAGQDGTGRLMQGYVELSNVSLVDEMANIMLAQRSYQMNARMLQVTDQVMETINNLRR